MTFRNLPRPRLAYWLYLHYRRVRWLPFGGRLWSWAAGRVDDWNGRRYGIHPVTGEPYPHTEGGDDMPGNVTDRLVSEEVIRCDVCRNIYESAGITATGAGRLCGPCMDRMDREANAAARALPAEPRPNDCIVIPPGARVYTENGTLHVITEQPYAELVRLRAEVGRLHMEEKRLRAALEEFGQCADCGRGFPRNPDDPEPLDCSCRHLP